MQTYNFLELTTTSDTPKAQEVTAFGFGVSRLKVQSPEHIYGLGTGFTG